MMSRQDGSTGRTGSLTVVGTGIQVAAHVTPAARACIEQADQVLYVVDNPYAAAWLQALNPTAESLRLEPDGTGKLRLEMYDAMVERILACVRRGLAVCAVFYGHPGIFTYPGHEAVRQARREGFKAQILPGISAADCLFADLAVDPAQSGCQMFDATDFLIHRRTFDASSELLLLQVAMVGDPVYQSYEAPGLPILVEELAAHYSPDHEVVIYEAATHPGAEPAIQRLPLSRLTQARLTAFSTLYVPARAPADVDLSRLIRLARARS